MYFSATGQLAAREASCMHSISAAPSVGWRCAFMSPSR